MIEKRRRPRVRALHLVAYGVFGDGKELKTLEIARTLDVSELGVRVETKTQLEPGQDLELDIAVGEELLRLRGRVTNCETGDAPLHEIGIELIGTSDEDRKRLVDGV